MVLICFLLGKVIGDAINTAFGSPTEFVFCSNVKSSDSYNIPFWYPALSPFPSVQNPDRGLFPRSTLPTLYHANWFYFNLRYTPCQYWYGESYPNNDIYSPPPLASGKSIRDSSFIAQPIGGWASNMLRIGSSTSISNVTTLQTFLQFQQQTSIIVGSSSAVSAADIGVKPFQAGQAVLAWSLASSGPAFVAPTPAAPTGLLGTIPTRYYFSTSSGIFYAVPYYNFSTVAAENSLDDFISTSINSVTAAIIRLDKSSLVGKNASAQNEVYTKAAALVSNLIHGGIYFTKIDHRSKSYSYNLHIGTTKIIESSGVFPGSGQRMLYQQTQLSNSILRNSDIAKFANAQITQGFRIFPEVGNTLLSFPIASFLGIILFPFGVSFLLPVRLLFSSHIGVCRHPSSGKRATNFDHVQNEWHESMGLLS